MAALSLRRARWSNEDTLVYRLRRPLLDGRTEIFLRPFDLLGIS
jgi:hypothetical protein